MPTLEEISKAIRSAGMAAEQLPGGIAKGKTREDFDPEQLKIGMEIEQEHTPDPAVAEEIAMDHLAEDPDYYKKLLEMEKGGVDKAVYAEMSARPHRVVS